MRGGGGGGEGGGGGNAARASNPGLPVHIRRERPPEALVWTDAQQARWAKVTLPEWTPYDWTLYLDADTRLFAEIGAVFEMLADGWELVICPSSHQADDLLWHVCDDERAVTLAEFGCPDVLQLQGGMFTFRQCEPVCAFFAAWRDEWRRWTGEDQAALLRAFRRAPVRLHLLGPPFNGGAVVSHRWGAVREKSK